MRRCSGRCDTEVSLAKLFAETVQRPVKVILLGLGTLKCLELWCDIVALQ